MPLKPHFRLPKSPCKQGLEQRFGAFSGLGRARSREPRSASRLNLRFRKRGSIGQDAFGARDENENQAVGVLALVASRKWESRRGSPLPEHEVQLGIRTGRPRGAPPGNTNRLIHGDYSAERIRRRKEVNVVLRNARNLIRRIEMMTWSRRALRRKMESISTVTPGEPTPSARAREGGPGGKFECGLSTWVPFPSHRLRDARPGMTSFGIRGSPSRQRHATVNAASRSSDDKSRRDRYALRRKIGDGVPMKIVGGKWSNWSGGVTLQAARRSWRPRTRWNSPPPIRQSDGPVRAPGTGHSFTPVNATRRHARRSCGLHRA